MKKNKMGRYREDQFSDSHEDAIDIDTGEPIREKKKASVLPMYMELYRWAEERRRRKFMAGSATKQFKAFRDAQAYGLTPGDLKRRWMEFEEDKFWSVNGFDWVNVVYSFNKKAK